MKEKHPLFNCKVHNRNGYYFTHKDLITDHIKYWEIYLSKYYGNECNLLEIGSLQGNSAIYWLNHLLTHDKSTLTCIEPFGRTKSVPDKKLFMHNINKTGQIDKLTHIPLTSDLAFEILTTLYDVIYIDGSHEADVVLRDCISSFKFCKPNGIIIMDDYKMPRVFATDKIGPKPSIDKFLETHLGKIEVLYKGYQVIIKKL